MYMYFYRLSGVAASISLEGTSSTSTTVADYSPSSGKDYTTTASTGDLVQQTVAEVHQLKSSNSLIDVVE